jgi:hypothetical protein
MFRVVTVSLPAEDHAALTELARSEYRRPRDEASVLLIRAIREATARDPEPDRDPHRDR